MNKNYYEYMNQICSSMGNYQDYSISESAVLIPACELANFVNYYRTISNSIDFAIGPESCLIIEKKLAEKYKDYNLTSIFGIENFITHIFSLFNPDYREMYVVNSQWLEKFIISNPPSHSLRFLEDYNWQKSNVSMNRLMALTRLLEDDTWLKYAYNKYKELKFTDFQKRPISIILFSRDYGPSLNILEKKNTVWEDKICGSIFAYPCRHGSTLPYLRTLLRTIHYILELHLHSLFVKKISCYNNFGNLFCNYLSENSFVKDFFDVHTLYESYIWRQTVIFLKKKYEDILPTSFEFDSLAWNDNGDEIVDSNNIIDIVSNLTHNRKDHPLFRITSMLIKSALLHFIGRDIKSDNEMINIMFLGKV